ncbi:MAG: hypothetical protein IPK60_03510 [Sandaracinaceae bacterium]|nr:hypothetical protein [Sandaracinaceae bacterium]
MRSLSYGFCVRTFSRLAGVFLLGVLSACSGGANSPSIVCNSPASYCESANACFNLHVDRGNCGACGQACGPVENCLDGECVSACRSGESLCSLICVDTNNDVDNCGGCSQACPSGYVCNLGQCDIVCPTSYSPCPGQGSVDGGVAEDAGYSPNLSVPYCANLSNDRINCGACDQQCDPGFICAGGECIVTCRTGTTACTSASGMFCVDTVSDDNNCGTCNQICTDGTRCVAGNCV